MARRMVVGPRDNYRRDLVWRIIDLNWGAMLWCFILMIVSVVVSIKYHLILKPWSSLLSGFPGRDCTLDRKMQFQGVVVSRFDVSGF